MYTINTLHVHVCTTCTYMYTCMRVTMVSTHTHHNTQYTLHVHVPL